jgi:hypothetical protein
VEILLNRKQPCLEKINRRQKKALEDPSGCFFRKLLKGSSIQEEVDPRAFCKKGEFIKIIKH